MEDNLIYILEFICGALMGGITGIIVMTKIYSGM